MDARMKTAEAIISCSPWHALERKLRAQDPDEHRNTGDTAQRDGVGQVHGDTPRRALSLRVKHCHSATTRRDPARRKRASALFALKCRGMLLEAIHLAPAVPANPRVQPVDRQNPALPPTYAMETLKPALAAIRTGSQIHLNEAPRMRPAGNLRVHSPLLGRIGHAINRQHIRRYPVVDAVLYRILQHIVEAVDHNPV